MAALTASFVENPSLISSDFNSPKCSAKPRYLCSVLYKFKVFCKLRSGSGHAFRRDSVEDLLTTSWALYDYKNTVQSRNQVLEQQPYDGEILEDSKSPEAEGEKKAIYLARAAQGKNGQRSTRGGNPSMSLSQSLDMQLNGDYTTEAVIRPVVLSKQLPGSAGLYMALVFALVGITTAGASLLGLNSSQDECTKCGGYGVKRCHLCNSTGIIEFERDFKDIIPCPLCIGSGVEKCSSCDGVRRRKGVPPFLQQEQPSIART